MVTGHGEAKIATKEEGPQIMGFIPKWDGLDTAIEKIGYPTYGESSLLLLGGSRCFYP
ncbi:hypothetical protein KKG61_00365 [bacterium]|nr:hypothetical protein [bacterium]MBU2461466.1 hypothetical protein [bacterium]